MLPFRAGKGHGMMAAMGRLISQLANAEVPAIAGFIVTCGGLFALHKLTAEEQAARAAQGDDPKLRPVNVPCNLLKWAFKLLLDSPQAKEAIRALSPIQMALEAK